MLTSAVTIGINATVDLEANQVHYALQPPRLDPYRIEVGLGDRVVWSFPEVPGYKPAVVFTAFSPSKDAPAEAALDLGAFESLQQDGNKITGTVGPAAVGSYLYWIWLVPMKPGLSYRRLLCAGVHEATIIDRLPPG